MLNYMELLFKKLQKARIYSARKEASIDLFREFSALNLIHKHIQSVVFYFKAIRQERFE